MDDRDEPTPLDAIAAEYVLGTLDADERRDFLRRLAREPAAVEAVRFWQARLAPLALGLAPVEPSAALLDRIEAAIGDRDQLPPPANDNRVARWRGGAIAAALVAMVATGLALRSPAPSPVTPAGPIQPVALVRETNVAALSEKGQTPGLFVTYDKASGRLHVIPIGLDADQQHSLELWLIKGKDAPRPMGLVDAKAGAEHEARIDTATATTFAVSREPVGGSPTGAPTGPVLYSGALVTLPGRS